MFWDSRYKRAGMTPGTSEMTGRECGNQKKVVENNTFGH